MSAGSARLDGALKTLRLHWEETKESWNDKVRQDFETAHMFPLESRTSAASGGWINWPRCSRRCGTTVADQTNGHPTAAPEVPEAPLIRRERALVRDLARLAAERAGSETGLGSGFASPRDGGRARGPEGPQGARRPPGRRHRECRRRAQGRPPVRPHRLRRRTGRRRFRLAGGPQEGRRPQTSPTRRRPPTSTRRPAGRPAPSSRPLATSVKRKFEALENRLAADDPDPRTTPGTGPPPPRRVRPLLRPRRRGRPVGRGGR